MLLSLLAILSFSGLSYANEPAEAVEAFFATVQAGDIHAAYDKLFVGSPIPSKQPQQVDMLKMQTKSGLPLLGNILGVEKVREELLGASVIRLVYIMKMDLSPLVWEFHFYKPQTQWILAKVIFNDQLQGLHRLQ